MAKQYIEDLAVEDIPFQTADNLLDSLSLPTMERSIRDQISGQFHTSRDFLDIVLNKFKVIEENADEDSIRGIRDEMMEWANSIILNIINKYNLGYNNPNEESLNSLNILETLYHFFVLDKRENTINFFIRYIDINKKEIIDNMELNTRSADITTMANKKKNLPKHNIPILSNLDEVIKYICHDAGITSRVFLDTINDGNYYIENIISYFDDDMIMGDFFQDYISEEVGNYTDDISMELRIEIRSHLSNV